jgi:hypothetical protein
VCAYISRKMVALLLVVISRLNTAPIGLLTLYSSLLVSDSVLLLEKPFALSLEEIAVVLGLLAALGSIASILRMPIRDPNLPNDQISPAFEVPDPRLRSPEDNLTLWQFMTVSWMAPLISLGATRQLNDQDVWSLSYEFQHRALHNAFRALHGSVLRRVLVANRIDLIIVSLLGIVELLASMIFFEWNILEEAAAELHNRLFGTCTIAATS